MTRVVRQGCSEWVEILTGLTDHTSLNVHLEVLHILTSKSCQILVLLNLHLSSEILEVTKGFKDTWEALRCASAGFYRFSESLQGNSCGFRGFRWSIREFQEAFHMLSDASRGVPRHFKTFKSFANDSRGVLGAVWSFAGFQVSFWGVSVKVQGVSRGFRKLTGNLG